MIVGDLNDGRHESKAPFPADTYDDSLRTSRFTLSILQIVKNRSYQLRLP